MSVVYMFTPALKAGLGFEKVFFWIALLAVNQYLRMMPCRKRSTCRRMATAEPL